MKVVLLGAGASKSYSNSPTGLKMPIAEDFFETFEALPISNNTWVLKEGLIGYLLKEKGISIEESSEYLKSGINIETLHSEIEAGLINLIDSNQSPFSSFHYRAYNELVFIFSCTINSIQNGPVSINHCRIAKLLSRNDTVITFNWDTLMDRALAKETNWQTDWGYSFLAKKIFRNSWQKSYDKNSTDTDDAPLLLKLHGSTNWITSYTHFDQKSGKLKLMQSSPPETVYVFEYSDKPFDTYAGRYMPGFEPFSYGYYPPNLLDEHGILPKEGHLAINIRYRVPWKPEGTAGKKGLVSMPLIIPPVRKKSYSRFGPLFSNLWKNAEHQLLVTDHIIVIGYSFPQTDLRSNDLFLQAFSKRETMPKVTIVDPKPQHIRDKFIYQFGVNESKLQVYEDYFSDDFPIEDILSDE